MYCTGRVTHIVPVPVRVLYRSCYTYCTSRCSCIVPVVLHLLYRSVFVYCTGRVTLIVPVPVHVLYRSCYTYCILMNITMSNSLSGYISFCSIYYTSTAAWSVTCTSLLNSYHYSKWFPLLWNYADVPVCIYKMEACLTKRRWRWRGAATLGMQTPLAASDPQLEAYLLLN